MSKNVPPVWIESKRRARTYWLFLLSCIPLLAVALFVMRSIYGVIVGMLLFVAALSWLCWRWVLWPCPRCGRPYFYKFPWGNVYRRKCAHCGLEKWADPVQEKIAAR